MTAVLIHVGIQLRGSQAHALSEGLGHAEMLLKDRKVFRGESFNVGIGPALSFSLEFGNVLFVVLDSVTGKFLVEFSARFARKLAQLLVLMIAGVGGQIDPFLLGKLPELVIRFRVVLDQPVCEAFDFFALSPALSELAHLDFHHSTFGGLLDEGSIRRGASLLLCV